MTRTAAATPGTIDFARLGAPPREVSLTRQGVAVVTLAGLIGVGAVIAAIGLSILHTRQDERAGQLQREGVVTAARILTMSGADDQGARRVTFAYTVNGDPFTAFGTLSQRESRRVAVGATIGVRYLPAEPQRSWIVGHEPGVLPLVLIPLIVLGLGALASLIGWRVQRARMLLSEGRFAYARITAAKKREHGHYRVSYEFTTLSGATRVARSDSTRTPPTIGTIVPVVYDREDPSRTALYPMSLVTPTKAI